MGFFGKESLIGSAVGGLGGALVGGASTTDIAKKLFGGSAGMDAGNPFSALDDKSRQALQDYYSRGANAGSDEFLASSLYRPQYDEYGQQIQSLTSALNPLTQQMQKYYEDPYKLQDKFGELYTQHAGDLARTFAEQRGAANQKIAASGLGRSGSADRNILTSHGNQAESLGALQTALQDQLMNRQQTMMQQMGQYTQGLGSQRNQLMQGRSQFSLEGVKGLDENAANKAKMALFALSGSAGQANEQFAQRKATANTGLLGAVRRGTLSGVEGGLSGGISDTIGKGFGKGQGMIGLG